MGDAPRRAAQEYTRATMSDSWPAGLKCRFSRRRLSPYSGACESSDEAFLKKPDRIFGPASPGRSLMPSSKPFSVTHPTKHRSLAALRRGQRPVRIQAVRILWKAGNECSLGFFLLSKHIVFYQLLCFTIIK